MEGGSERYEVNNVASQEAIAFDQSLITLVLRGERYPLRNAIASCFNRDSGRLLVASAQTLWLFANLLELGGELLQEHRADEKTKFVRVVCLPWLEAYGVVTQSSDGALEHRCISGNLTDETTTHEISPGGALLSIIVNATRREVITSDTHGGFRVWVLRASGRGLLTECKGFQRVHAGNHKTMYAKLSLTQDSQTIIACTRHSIHAFDATTCARLGTYFKDSSAVISGCSFDRYSQAMYLQRPDRPRSIHKLEGVVARGGRLHMLRPGGCYTHRDDVVTFQPIERGALHNQSSEACGEVVILDSCGNLSVVACSQSHDSDTPHINLQLAPSTEQYLELHADTRSDSPRNYVIVVGSSGMYVVEVFLPITSIHTVASTRRIVTNVMGSKLSLIQSGDWKRMAILNHSPPSLLLLQSEVLDDFYSILLHHVSSHDASYAVANICALPGGIVTAWSCGDITHFDLATERTTSAGSISASPSALLVVSTVEASSSWLFVGDDGGSAASWSFNSDGVATFVASKSLHHSRIISMINAHEGDCPTQLDTLCMVSAAADGEVKVWQVRFLTGVDVRLEWDLQLCFRTYAQSISACALMGDQFFFAGSNDGGFECWRLPTGASSQKLASRHQRSVAVLKKALHSIDLHLTRVCQVVVESGDAAERIATSPQHLDEFAWVITYDADRVLFIWCASATFLFPHRRLRLHASPTGIVLDGGIGQFYLMGYIGRCLECIDVLTELDRLAVFNRLAKARATADLGVSGRSLYPTQIVQPQLDRAYAHDVSMAVRLYVTLPTVDHIEALHDIEAARPPSPMKHSPLRHSEQERVDSIQRRRNLLDTSEAGADTSGFGLPMGSMSSPSPQPRTDTISVDVPTARSRTQMSTERKRRLSQPLASSYQTSAQFSSARPRTYKSSSRPITTSAQSRCAVVTAMIPSRETEAHAPFISDVQGHTSQHQQQDKVAIVSLAETNGEVQLRLDFGGRSRTRASLVDGSSAMDAADHHRAKSMFLDWSSLQGEHQSVELMAASRSRGVREAAQADNVAVPTLAEFTSSDVKAQLKVRSFSRWYLANQMGRQRVRELFLVEELQFAARDGNVQLELKRSGGQVPSTADDTSSSAWIAFAMWYATGSHASMTPAASLSSVVLERMSERTAFLKRRMDALVEVEEGDATSSEPLYLFDDIPSAVPVSSEDSPSAWHALSDASRAQEVMMALRDPAVQLAAMLDDIILPDHLVAAVDSCDILTLAEDFIHWWSAPTNFPRSEFLLREVKAARLDPTVQSILEQTLGSGATVSERDFAQAYFQSEPARRQFLESKRIQSLVAPRIQAVLNYGKLPAPLLIETLPAPLTIPFAFPAQPVPVATQATRRARDPSMRRLDTGGAGEEDDDFEDVDELREVDEDDSSEREQAEIALMTVEDALSRELNDAFGAASDDEQDEVDPLPVDPPKRTDFTTSYFFGNLPKKFRINSGGWLAGSGLDNGDEELEEEERLDRERQRQEMLDRLEAERIAEAERLAEKLRLDKEREDKAMQLRRLHQIELKKILAHQLELEQKRAVQIEHDNRISTLAAMVKEERAMREWLVFLESERRRMIAEDQRAAAIRKAEREAKVMEMRRVLAELTLMAAEDRRSAAAQAQQLQKELRDRMRVEYLTELYEPFDPYYPSSSVPSESSLPSLQRRANQRLRHKTGKAKQWYAMPFAEAVAMEDVEREAYAVRDSRKLRRLLGLPVGTPQSRKGMRIPSERDIIKSRRQLQLMLPIAGAEASDEDEDRQEELSPATRQSKSNQVDHTVLPAIARPRVSMPDVCEDSELTDLAVASALANEPEQSTATPSKSSTNRKSKPRLVKPSSVDAARQQTALPFFRGNFGVRGEGKSRASDYAAR